MNSRPWEDKAGELATSSVTGRGGRRQKVIRGTDMVTPREPVTLKENGRIEELVPGRDRLSKKHPWVVQHPELFRACDSKDIETIRTHGKLAERKLRRLGGTTTRADTRPHRKFSLGPERPRERWRLP